MTPQALFTLDLGRCTGCSACAVACSIENDVGEGLAWREIHSFNAERRPGLPTHHLSLACNHCVDPACQRGCPAAAYDKHPITGAVLLDPERCIGCGYCRWVCPYDAPQFNPQTGVMEKCTFCSHRLAEGREPACVQACPVEALGFEPRAEPTPQVVPGFPDTGLSPAIAFRKPDGRRPPQNLAPASTRPLAEPPRLDRTRLASEWPLLAFSLIVTGMVAWLWAAVAGDLALHGPGFAAAGVVAMAVSTLHLGRPARAWRAMLNWRTSWVSREILGFSTFWTLGSAWALLALPDALGWLAAAAGLGTLVCVDMVYRVPGQRYDAVPHSAMTGLTALFVTGLLLRVPWLALAAGGAKLLFYPWPAVVRGELPHAVTVLRVGLGFAWPLLIGLARPEASVLVWIAGPVLAEAIDRARFYAELSFMNPARRIALDGAAASGAHA